MNVSEIVQQLKQERSRLDAAIHALEGTEGHGKRRGRPAGRKNNTKAPKRRTMSAAARKRISEMINKRWAERKTVQK